MNACSIVQRLPAIDRSAFAASYAGKHFVDRRVADRVRRHAPAKPIELLDDSVNGAGFIVLHAEERAALAPRFRVRLAHPAAFESAVDAELHAADAHPLVAFVRA